ncbi:hypothetical protein [Compostimonas suwonensis]|uniref:hypothetical protein n=1 Tax=Compostimonas suwonensis TaxID=1048394 RepID=UPI000C245D64|nr:hypothetical protein [Compostimonas suwonensis]
MSPDAPEKADAPEGTEALTPPGTYAVWEGEEYPARGVTATTVVLTKPGAGDPPPGFERSVTPGIAGTRIVPRDSLDRLYTVTATGRWRGEPFDILGSDGSSAWSSYTGRDVEWALRQPELQRTDLGTFQGLLPVHELTGIHEVVTELAVVR